MNSLVSQISSVVEGNWHTVLSFNRDTQKAVRTLAKSLGSGSVPTFSGLTLTSLTLTGMSGVLKATAGVVSGSAVHANLGSIGANDHHNQVHVLNGADHTVSGLTTGHVLQATGAATFGFAAVPGLHDSVTLAVTADVLLGLTGQALSLDTQTATYVLAGPVSGTALAPTFRALVSTDIPSLSYEVPLTFSTGLNRTTNTITCTITQYTDALARAAALDLTGTLNVTGKIDLSLTNTVAGGAVACSVDAIQDTNALTGTLRGVYSVVTNGAFASSGTIRAFEGKVSAATSGLVGGNVGTLEGMSLTVDAKNKTVTTLRGAEIILDGQAGAAVTTATGLRISNNFQANIATTSYGIQIYADSFPYTYGIDLSTAAYSGGDINLDQPGVIKSAGKRFIRVDDTNFNTFVGTQACNNYDGLYNTCVGYQAGYNNNNTTGNEGKYNTYYGYRAGYGGATGSKNTGCYNNAMGYGALRYNTTGERNNAMGFEALYSNTTGYYNNAMGAYALFSNTTGYYNNAMGYAALYSNTTGDRNNAMGFEALYSNTTGYQNNAMGVNALYANTTGYYNNAMGYAALRYLRPTSKAITAFADSGTSPGTKVTVTSAAHGQLDGVTVQITGTTNYEGSYVISNKTTDTFDITKVFVANDATGWWSIVTEARRNVAVGAFSGYRQTTISDALFIDNQDRATAAAELTKSLVYGKFDAVPANQTFRVNGKIGAQITPLEDVHAADTVRADTFFNLNGTDGVTQAAAAGTVADPIAIAGGIVTAQTQITYITDGAHSLVGITSITTANGRITAMA